MHSFSSLRPARWAVMVCLAVLVGCGGLTAEDERVCAGVVCSAGFCLAEGGQPVCHCGAWEQALGIECFMKGAVLEPDDTLEGATPLTPGAEAPPFAFGERAPGERDTDTFVFEATAGHAYGLTCESSAVGCRLQVLDAAGGLGPKGSGTPRATVYFEPAQAGRYYVQVAPELLASGDYRLTLEDLGVDDCGDSREEACPRTPSPESFTLRRETPEDRDVISFPVTQGHFYQVACTSAVQSDWTLAAGYIDVTSSYYSTTGYARAALVGFKATRDGTFFAEPRDYALPGYPIPPSQTYTCRLEDFGPDDHGDTPATATVLVPGTASASGEGFIQMSGDSDVFTFAGVAGHLYRFMARYEGGGSPRLFVRLGDAPGFTYTSEELVELAADVPVFVSVSETAVRHYSYQLEDLGVDDCGGSAATACPLALNTPTSVNVAGVGDVDDLTFNAVAQHIYRLTVTPPLYLDQLSHQVRFSMTGSTLHLGYSQPQPSEAQYLLESTQDGPVLVQLKGEATRYELLLEDIGQDDYGDSLATAAPLTLGQTVTGHTEVPGDYDYFTVSLEAGRAYTLSLAGASQDAVVFGSSGASLASLYSSGSVDFTPSQAGTYLVRVYGSASGSDYQLTLQ